MEDHFARVLGANDSNDRKRQHQDDGIHKGRDVDALKRAKSAASVQQQREREIAEALARADTQEIEIWDPRTLKSMAMSLEKHIRKNAMMRSKYADTPAKFMDSEVALDEELTKWKGVATAPALYRQLIDLNVLPMLLGLFAHENVDIRLDVVTLIAELTDADDAEASLPATLELVQALLDQKLLPLLVTNMYQLDNGANTQSKQSENEGEDAEEEAAGIYNSLQILENLADLVPASCEQMCISTPIFPFLLQQVSSKRRFTQNKLYASEILSILLQSDRVAQQQFINKKLEVPAIAASALTETATKDNKPQAIDGIDELLQAIAPYRKKNPSTDEEEELVENLFNSLCSVLLLSAAQSHFRHLEGLELMLRCMKDRKQFVFRGALRVLNHALMGNARNCARVIEIGGLKSLFSVFMGKKKGGKTGKKNKAEKAQDEENIVSIVASLCALLDVNAKFDVYDRFHAKFVENEMEKIDRLVDLFVKYHERVEKSGHDDESDEEEDEEERYLRRLDAGLFVLQQIAFIVAHLCQFSKKHQAYVMVKFHERNLELEHLMYVLREQLTFINADSTPESKEKPSERDAEQKEKQEAHKKQLLELLQNLEQARSIGVVEEDVVDQDAEVKQDSTAVNDEPKE